MTKSQSFTAKDAKDGKERNSLTAKDTKDAKGTIIKTTPKDAKTTPSRVPDTPSQYESPGKALEFGDKYGPQRLP